MTSRLETGQSVEQNDGLTPEQRDLRKLFLLSFRYSQGDSSLQHNLFRWSILNGFIPSQNVLPDQAPLYIRDITPPHLHESFINLNKYASEKRIYERAVQHEWASLVRIVGEKDKDPIIREYLIEDITIAMIGKDAKYQNKKRPKRENSETAVPDSYEDPHKSYIRKHAVLKEPTGHASYDLLFEEMEGVIEQLGETSAFKGLVLAWNANHKQSGETFFGNA